MCVAIVKPKGKTITKKELKQAWNTNPDGAGFAFSKAGKLHCFKSMDKNKFINTAFDTMKKIDSTFLIHFRIATQGAVNIQNAHPFFVNKNLAFIHNGHIPGMKDSEKISDTRYFNIDILQQLPYKMNNKTHDKLIASAIGYSKLAFLNNAGEYNIINENLGSWKRGIWFSNLNHCRAPKLSTNQSIWRYNGMQWDKEF
jgi:predicted glutamine amidotransferase